MGWYEAIKDGINVAQKADNMPLVKELLEAQKQMFELVNENHQLKEEIKKYKEITEIHDKIERHKDAYITLKDDPDKIIYCSACWDTKRILVQGQVVGTGKYKCPACGIDAYYDREEYNRVQTEAWDKMLHRKSI